MANRKIEHYELYYTPGGAGVVGFKLAGSRTLQYTDPLSATVFAALAAVLAQRNITWDDQRNMFMSYDDDHGVAFDTSNLAME